MNSTKINQVSNEEKLLDFAEICGIHAGDGWLSSYNNEVGFGTSINEEAYFNYVYHLYSKTFTIKIYRILKRPENGTIELRVQSKEIQSLLVNSGFKRGPKIDSLSIPKFILNKREYALRFLRGLIDTDGYIYWRKSINQYYLIIQIGTASEEFAKELMALFKTLDFHPSIKKYEGTITKKGNKRKDFCRISLHRIKDVTRFIPEINFKNPTRINQIKRRNDDLILKYGPDRTRTGDLHHSQ